MAISVLLIDDDPEFRAWAAHMLTDMELSVVAEADSVEAAIRAARKLRPQSALVDVGLPDGDGVTLAATLAALPWRPRIVLTSTDPDAMTDAGAQSVGAAAFIAKHDLPDSALPALLSGHAEQEYG